MFNVYGFTYHSFIPYLILKQAGGRVEAPSDPTSFLVIQTEEAGWKRSDRAQQWASMQLNRWEGPPESKREGSDRNGGRGGERKCFGGRTSKRRPWGAQMDGVPLQVPGCYILIRNAFSFSFFFFFFTLRCGPHISCPLCRRGDRKRTGKSYEVAQRIKLWNGIRSVL